VTLFLLPAAAPVLAGGWPRPSRGRISGLVRFGLRSAAAGLLTELNLRIDVLMLGLFLPDRDVGIYAFAALLIEGLANITLVLRNLINPYLTRMLAARDDAGLRLLVRRVLLAALPAAMLTLAGTWLFYQPAIRLLLGPGDLELALAPLLLLIALMTPYFGYAAFEDALMLAGRAGTQSLYQLAVTAGNAALNFALIPFWGILGAATATGLASLLACLALVTVLRHATGLSLLPWPAGMRLSAAGKDW
jgi:O-antigen/teichoic acid export membrane protein